MTNVKLKNGGKNFVTIKWGDQAYNLPIDPVTQQFACEIKTSFWNQYIAGFFDRRYRRRGLDDRMYFLNVLQARQSPIMQGWMLFFKNFFVLPIVMSPWHLFKGDYWGMHEVTIFLALCGGWYWLDYKRTQCLEFDIHNWAQTINHHGLQAVINEIQSS